MWKLCWKEGQRWQKVTETKVKSCKCCIRICFPINVCLLEQCGLFGQFNHSKHFTLQHSKLLIHTDPYTDGGDMCCLLICTRKHSYTYTQTQMTKHHKGGWRSVLSQVYTDTETADQRTTALTTEPQPPSFPRPVHLWRKLGVNSAFTTVLQLELQAVIDVVMVALAMVSSHVSTTFCIGVLQTILLPGEEYCLNSY